MGKTQAEQDAENEEHHKRWVYSHHNPGFEGTYEFDLTIDVFGRRIARKARAVYRHTPEWEYFDLKKKGLFVGAESTAYGIEILAVPEEFHDDGSWTEGTPEWIGTEDLIRDGVLPIEARDEIIQGIDDKCRAGGAERRRAAGK